MIIALESFLCLNPRSGPGGSFYAEKQSGANDVISLFNLNLIPKSNKRHAMTDWILSSKSSLPAAVLCEVTVVCTHYFE